MISAVKKVIEVPLIVGGGIRDAKTAYEKVKAGADIIVTGNAIEESKDPSRLMREIADAVHKAGKERK